MPMYRVQIEASNFLVAVDDVVARRGFVTFRYVEAADPESAEDAAVQMLRDEQALRELVRNKEDDPAVMNVVEIAELETEENVTEQPGLIWFEMNPKRWWPFRRR